MYVAVNGREVATAEFGETPGWISFKEHLRRGPNSIEVTIVNGPHGGCYIAALGRLIGQDNQLVACLEAVERQRLSMTSPYHPAATRAFLLHQGRGLAPTRALDHGLALARELAWEPA